MADGCSRREKMRIDVNKTSRTILALILTGCGVLAAKAGISCAQAPSRQGAAPTPGPAIRFKDGAKSVRIHVSLFDNIIYFPAKVNGAAGLDFVLDTGASDVSVLDQGVVEARGLPRGRGTTGGGAGPEQVQMWELESATLSLPGMEIAGFRFIAIPMKRMEPYWGRKKDGLFGGNILGRLVTRIDYDGRTVTFYDPGSFEAPKNGQIVPLTVEANTLFVTAKVKAEGSDVPMEGLFMLDTGVRMTFFNTPFTEKNRLIPKSPRTLENIAGFGIGGASRATMGRLASLQIGDFVVERPVVQFNTATRGIEASSQFDGIIGADILSRFIVTLDYQNQRMMLRKGARFEQPFEYDMSGLYFVTAGDRNDVFKVENVVTDSPAAKAGVEKGDILVSVDNKPASSFTLETLKRHMREAGRAVALQVQRAGKTMDFSFRLERLI
jgi:hypothetical protein